MYRNITYISAFLFKPYNSNIKWHLEKFESHLLQMKTFSIVQLPFEGIITCYRKKYRREYINSTIKFL